MKKFVLSIIIAAGGLITQNAVAQVGVNVGMRIGPLVINVLKPIAPAVVYDDFYYLPEVDAYYSVPERCYYYMDGGGSWVNAAYLPGRYHDYDWRTARRYEVRAQRPYANHEYYRNKYNGNRGGNWGNDQYAYRGPQGRNDRGNYGRLPSSPYDSNNAGRGEYNQPNRNNDNRGNWNGQGRDNNDRGNGRNGGNSYDDNRGNWNGQGRDNNGRGNGSSQPDRNQGGGNQNWGGQQGGNNGNTNWQPNRGGNNPNGNGQPANPGNNQPSNQNGGQGGNNNWQPNRGGNNQPASQNGDRGGNRANMPDRMHFSRNMVEGNGRMQVVRN